MHKFELDEYHRNVSDGNLLADVCRVATTLGTDYVSSETYGLSGGKYSRQTLIRRFGSWNKALSAAGLTVTKRMNIPEEELFANLESVWRHLGRQPRHSEVCKPLSLFAGSAYDKRFGSWRKALESFVAFINAPNTENDGPELAGQSPSSTWEPERAQKASRHINWRTRFLVMRRDDFKCQYCGRSPANNPGLELHIDHVKAFSKNGPSVMENLCTACNVCNIGKSDLDATHPSD